LPAGQYALCALPNNPITTILPEIEQFCPQKTSHWDNLESIENLALLEARHQALRVHSKSPTSRPSRRSNATNIRDVIGEFLKLTTIERCYCYFRR
jgi:hypothetical protein